MKKIFYFCCLLFGIQQTQAQTDVFNNGQIYITSSTDTLQITGSLINNIGADLNNAGGNLFVKKDITNHQANMPSGGGKLFTNGTTTQTVFGTANFKTHNWILDNTTNITLNNRVEVGNGTGGILSFINGKITSGNAMQDVFFNANSGYTGFTDNNHIIGYCSKDGITNFTYPIGNGTIKSDLDIANLSTSSTFQCKYFGNIFSSLTTTAPLVSVFDKEYWILDRTTGTSGSNVTLKWNDARKALDHTNPSGLRVGHYTGSSWISEGGTGSGNTATGSVTSSTISSYSPFTFASESTVLPILVSGYSAYVNGNCDAVIKWKSFEDGLSKKYILQKLINNIWINVSEISAKTFGENNYSIIDFKSEKGINSYRVATESYNGTNHYTAVKSLNINCKKSFIKVFPTITNSTVNVSLPENGQIFITTSNGKSIFETYAKAGYQILNLRSFVSGVYIITVKSLSGVSNFKVIKE